MNLQLRAVFYHKYLIALSLLILVTLLTPPCLGREADPKVSKAKETDPEVSKAKETDPKVSKAKEIYPEVSKSEETYLKVGKAREEMRRLIESNDLVGFDKAMRSYEESWSESSLQRYAYATQYGLQVLGRLAYHQGSKEAARLQYKYMKEFVSLNPERKHPLDYELGYLLTCQATSFGNVAVGLWPKEPKLLKKKQRECLTMLLTLWSNILQVAADYVEFDVTQPGYKVMLPYNLPDNTANFHGKQLVSPSWYDGRPKIKAHYTLYYNERLRRITGRWILFSAVRANQTLLRNGKNTVSGWYQGKPNRSEIENLIEKIVTDKDQARVIKAALLP